MRKYHLSLFLLLILVGTIPMSFTNADHEDDGKSDLETNTSNAYRIEMIASNFKFQVIDLVKVDRLVESGWNETQARINASFYDEVHNLGYGTPIEIHAKSSEGTHGIHIDELGLELFLEKPETNDTYGPEVVGSSVLPSVDTTIRVYCNVWCGSGHSEMDFNFIVGEGLDFSDGSIDILSDWRIWAMFGTFFVVTAGIVGIAVVKPRFFFTWDDDQTDD